MRKYICAIIAAMGEFKGAGMEFMNLKNLRNLKQKQQKILI
jgi:hypothetical protein